MEFGTSGMCEKFDSCAKIYKLIISTYVHTMAIQVVEFSSGGTKLGRFLHKNQHTQRK